MHSRRRIAALFVLAPTAVIALAACGSGDSTVSGAGSSSSTAVAVSSSAPGSTSSAAPSTDPNAPATTDPNAAAVPGPQLPAATSIPPGKQDPSIVGQRCDTANGPEGALRVVIFPGGSAACSAVMPVAKKYGPLISTGRNQSVDGWSCGPSQTTGVLATCTRGNESFGFIPQ